MDSGEGLSGNPLVVGPRAQEFLGVRYYLCGHYYQRKGVRLHRVVWEAANGAIPSGFHVHHVNGDRGDNALGNLHLMAGSAHLSHHGYADPRPVAAATRDAAARWHGSAEGRKWHSDHWRAVIAPVAAQRVDKTCEVCGAAFTVSALVARRTRFCHQNCKARALRARRAAERTAGRLLSGD